MRSTMIDPCVYHQPAASSIIKAEHSKELRKAVACKGMNCAPFLHCRIKRLRGCMKMSTSESVISEGYAIFI